MPEVGSTTAIVKHKEISIYRLKLEIYSTMDKYRRKTYFLFTGNIRNRNQQLDGTPNVGVDYLLVLSLQ